jgi:hypothetical protein
MTQARGAKVYVVAKGRHLGNASGHRAKLVRGFDAIPAMGRRGSETFVVTDDAAALRAVTSTRERVLGTRVVVLDEVTPTQLDILRARFSKVLAQYEGMKRLPDDQLLEVLAAPNADELFIAGAVDRELDALVLYRGNLERLVAPLSSFTPVPGATPDFERLEIGEYGHSIRLGGYEAATDAILYENDALYRRSAKRRLVASDPSLGASIRRLRLQRGVGRSEFPGVSEKQVARIERGETPRPRAATLRVIAERLRVRADELGSF